MGAPYTRLYVHCVWATTGRLPLIQPEIEVRLHEVIATKCRELGCHPIAVGGTEDHLHLLVGLAAALSVADLVQAVKGASSRVMNRTAMLGGRIPVAERLRCVHPQQARSRHGEGVR